MKILISGGGAAAVEAAIWARQSTAESEIVLCTAEPILPYRRPLLPMALIQDIPPERFFINPAEFYRQHNIKIKFNMTAQRADVRAKRVFFKEQEPEYYDRLIIAIGSSARQIIQPGLVDNVFTLHDYCDVEAIRTALASRESVTVVGGGILGLECAYSLLSSGRKVTIIESRNSLMQGLLDDECSAYLLRQIRQTDNLTVLTGCRLDHLCNINHRIRCKFSSGTLHQLTTDCVICAAGIIPGQISGLSPESWQVDEFMKLNGVDDVFGAGDCVKAAGCRAGSYSTARRQGRIAGLNASGAMVKFEVPVPEIRAAFAQTKLYCAGNTAGNGSVEKCEITSRGLQKLYYRQNKLVGAVLIGDTAQSGNIYQAIEQKQ